MSSKKYKWEVVAKDYNAPFIKNYIFTKSFLMQTKMFRIFRTALGIVSQKNQIEFITDFSTWQKAHDDLIKKLERNSDYVEGLIKNSEEWCKKMNKWTEYNLLKADLKEESNKKLFALLNKFVEMQAAAYAGGTVLPILDFGDFSFIEGNLEKYLKEKVGEKDYQKYYRVFTEPVHNSFAQDQEEDLLRLLSKFIKNGKWKSDVKGGNLSEIKKKHKDFYNVLKKHTKKHCWVYYVFMGPAYTEDDFLGFVKEFLNKKEDPVKKLNEIKLRKNKIKLLKRKYLKKLKPDKFHLKIINFAGIVIWAKPRRKDYQSKSYYHSEFLLREIARRLNISLSQTRSAPLELLERALVKNKKLDIDRINQIYNFHVCFPDSRGEVIVLSGKAAEEFSKKEIIRNEEKISFGGINEIRGTIAVGGVVKGIVKIINHSGEMGKMKEGNILVSAATAPNLVPAMKKASAIITDEGGLTCHASIVSRELNTPCIIGTKIATQVLEDGDMVEVDAERGIVRILRKAKKVSNRK